MKSRALKGFSLIEVVIAGALIAVLGIALFTSLRQGLQLKKEVTTRSSRFHLGRQSMERMAQELSMAYLSAQKNASELVVLTNFKGEKEKIAFDAFGNAPFAKDAKESDQREISYFIEKDKVTDIPGLMRKVHNNLTLKLGEEGSVDVMCPNVSKLEFRYWDPRDQDWKTTWTTDGSDAQVTLPPRIEIALEIFIEGEEKQKFLTQVELWTLKPIMISK